MGKLSPQKSRLPLYGLLIVQLLTGITLMPTGNFFGIYLNEVIAYPIRQVAQVIAWGQVVGMFASLVGGGLSDRWGHKRVWVLGVGAIALSSLVYVFRAPWIIILLWGLGGAGLGFSTLGSQSYLTLATGVTTLGLFSALYNWGYTIGGAVGNPLAALILDQTNFYVLGLVLAGMGLCTILIASFLPQLRAPTSTRSARPALAGYQVLLHRRIFLLRAAPFSPNLLLWCHDLAPFAHQTAGRE